MPASDRQRLYGYLLFYRTYPQIGDVVPGQWKIENLSRALEAKTSIVRSPTGIKPIPGQMFLDRLSYTHLELLSSVEDSLKRAFYEIECIRGNWSVRQLRRQITSLYFERSGLSKDKKKLSALVQKRVE